MQPIAAAAPVAAAECTPTQAASAGADTPTTGSFSSEGQRRRLLKDLDKERREHAHTHALMKSAKAAHEAAEERIVRAEQLVREMDAAVKELQAEREQREEHIALWRDRVQQLRTVIEEQHAAAAAALEAQRAVAARELEKQRTGAAAALEAHWAEAAQQAEQASAREAAEHAAFAQQQQQREAQHAALLKKERKEHTRALERAAAETETSTRTDRLRAEAAVSRAEAKAAHRGAKAAHAALLAAEAAACAAQDDLRRCRMREGKLLAKVSKFESAEKRREAQSGTLRTIAKVAAKQQRLFDRRDSDRRAELAAARDVVAELRTAARSAASSRPSGSSSSEESAASSPSLSEQSSSAVAGRQMSPSELAAERLAATQAAKALGLVVLQPPKDGGRTKPGVLEGMRRLADVCHVPDKHVSTAIDTVVTMLSGEVPPEAYQLSERAARVAHATLGEIDRRRDVAENIENDDPHSINSDTGNKKDTEREVVCLCDS